MIRQVSISGKSDRYKRGGSGRAVEQALRTGPWPTLNRPPDALCQEPKGRGSEVLTAPCVALVLVEAIVCLYSCSTKIKLARPASLEQAAGFATKSLQILVVCHSNEHISAGSPGVTTELAGFLDCELFRKHGWPRRAEARSRASRLAPRAEISDSAPRRLGASAPLAWPGPP